MGGIRPAPILAALMDPRIRAGMWECHRRVGERIAEAAFRENPAGDASNVTLGEIAALFFLQAAEFTTGLGGDDGDKQIGRLVILKAMRARYRALCASAASAKHLIL